MVPLAVSAMSHQRLTDANRGPGYLDSGWKYAVYTIHDSQYTMAREETRAREGNDARANNIMQRLSSEHERD